MANNHKLEVTARRKQLRELIRQGIYNTSELAKILGVTVRTIRNDLQALGDEVWEELRGAGMVRVMEDILKENYKIIDAAWEEYSQTENGRVKTRCLDIIADRVDSMVSLFQRMGIIAKVPDMLVMSHAEVDDDELIGIIEDALKKHFDARLGRKSDSA